MADFSIHLTISEKETYLKTHICENMVYTDASTFPDNLSRARLRPTGVTGGEYINASFVDVSKEAPEVIDPLCV